MRYSIWFKSINYFQFFVSCVQNLFCVCVFICTKHIPSEPRTWRQEMHRGGPLGRTCRWAMLQKNNFSLTSFKWTGDGCNTRTCSCTESTCAMTLMGCFTITKAELQKIFPRKWARREMGSGKRMDRRGQDEDRVL